jgi:hypothetical protein
VPGLLPGTYSVLCEHAGFKKITAGPLTVNVNQTLRVDLNLQVGDTTESVTIQEYASLVQTDNATIGQVVTTRQLAELPLNGRDFRSLLRLNPGVTEPRAASASPPPSAARASTTASKRQHQRRPPLFGHLSARWRLPQRTPLPIPQPGPSHRSRRRVQTPKRLYPAEFGMGVGQVSIAMKSGTNAVHGSMFNFLRNDALQKFHPAFPKQNPAQTKQFGVVVGGPGLHPQTLQRQKQELLLRQLPGRAPRHRQQRPRPGAHRRREIRRFGAWSTQLFDPLSGTLTPGQALPIAKAPFPANRIPSTRFAPQSAALLKYWPEPTQPCVSPCNNFVASTNTPVVMDQYTVRADTISPSKTASSGSSSNPKRPPPSPPSSPSPVSSPPKAVG